jgi:uncharacterized protein YchJ
MYNAIYVTSYVHLSDFPCGIFGSADILFIETTHPNAPTQTEKSKIEIKKWMIGTKITLLVQARKSAEASITSIANFKDLNPQITQNKNATDKIARIMNPANQIFDVF